MLHDQLSRAIVSRLQELGLPPSLIDLEEFRSNFLLNRWVMFVRDRDKIADVHLVQPPSKPPGNPKRHR